MACTFVLAAFSMVASPAPQDSSVLVEDPISALYRAPSGRPRRTSSGSIDPGSNDDFATLAPGAETPLAQLVGPGVITHLWINLDCRHPYAGRMLVLRAWWDGEDSPSVEVPLGDFFAVGHALERDVNSELVHVTGQGRARNCYWPMPFDHSARLAIRNDSPFPVRMLFYAVNWLEKDEPFGPQLRTFHAAYSDSGGRGSGREFILADLVGEGHYVGTVLSIDSAEEGWPGEGDDRFYVDGDEAPTLVGSGLEDYFCSGWGFRLGGAGHSGVTVWEGMGAHARTTAYRWHVRDPIPFQSSLTVAFERMGWAVRGGRWQIASDRPDHFSGVAFWYQKEPHGELPPLPSLPDRLPFAEERIELEDVVTELAIPEGAPRLRVEEDPLWAFGAQVSFPAQRQADCRIRIPFNILRPDFYGLVLRWTLGPMSPVITVFLDGKPLGGPFDLYSEETRIAEQLLGRPQLAEGPHVLELRAVGRHHATGGFKLGLDSLMIRWRSP